MNTGISDKAIRVQSRKLKRYFDLLEEVYRHTADEGTFPAHHAGPSFQRLRKRIGDQLRRDGAMIAATELARATAAKWKAKP